MARNQRSSSAGIGAAPVMATSHSSRPSSSRTGANADLVEELAGRRAARRWRGPSRCASAIGAAASTASSNCAGLLGVGAERGRHAGVDLLPHARHAEHDVRVAPRARYARDLAGLGAAGDLVADEAPAGSGWSCARRCGPSAGTTRAACRRARRARSVGARLSTVHAMLRVGEHHALGRSGGARRVDDRGQVVGSADLGRLGQVDRLGARAASRRRNDVVGRDPVGVVEDADAARAWASSSRTSRKRSRKPLVLDDADAAPRSGRPGTATWSGDDEL